MADPAPLRQVCTPSKNVKWLVLAVASIGTLSATLDTGMTSVAYPALAEAFDTDTSTVLWVTVAFWVSNVGLLLTVGWIGDVAGRRRIFTLGFVIYTLGLLLASGAFTVWQLIGLRVFQGFGAAMIQSNITALVVANFPPEERGKALGVVGAVVGVGLSVGPLAGGVLIDVLDWRALFYSRAPLAALGAALGWWLLPRDHVAHTRFRVDFIGALALFGTLGLFLLAVNQGGKLGFGSPTIISMAVSSALLLAVLVWSQRRSVRPILDFALFKSRQYTAGLLVVVFHYLSNGGVLLVAPFFFMDAMGFSATKMGLFVGAFFIARTVLAPQAGWLSDRVGARPFLVLGNLLMAVALLWLSRLGTDAAQWALLSAMVMAGAGAALFEPVVTSVVIGSVPRDRLGTAAASVVTGRQIAFAVGVAVAGAIYTIRERVYLERVGDIEAIAGGFSDTLLAGVVLAALAVVFSLMVRDRPARRRRKAPTDAPVAG